MTGHTQLKMVTQTQIKQEAGERGGVLSSTERRGRVLLVAEEACLYCQEEESTDVKGVLLGEWMLSRFGL